MGHRELWHAELEHRHPPAAAQHSRYLPDWLGRLVHVAQEERERDRVKGGSWGRQGAPPAPPPRRQTQGPRPAAWAYVEEALAGLRRERREQRRPPAAILQQREHLSPAVVTG